jgi:hypothetical protein
MTFTISQARSATGSATPSTLPQRATTEAQIVPAVANWRSLGFAAQVM